MPKTDYRGARGSGAGDDYHELWALRQALGLLDQDSGLTAVTVEGLRSVDEAGSPADTWDGVDCALYFGGDEVTPPNRIVIQQFKYSAAAPDSPWTVSRLSRYPSKRPNTSVIGKLARGFLELSRKYPDLTLRGDLVVRLISNQTVDPAVREALSDLNADSSPAAELRGAIRSAGLSPAECRAFASAVDLTECGQGSRFELELRSISAISSLTEEDARAEFEHLIRFVQRAMLPESKGDVITRATILAQFYVSDPAGLFPCPSEVEVLERPIHREAARHIADRLRGGESAICIHGEGGCGKTTVLQEIGGLLPTGSVMVTFDCYGRGRYLDSDAYRHREQDAYLQLTNDLSRTLRTPYLLTRSGIASFPRVFKKRLKVAASVVAAQGNDALLVVAVDAADNSIVAADSCSETSFIHSFASLGDLPRNVRFLVTARTGRTSKLRLPRTFGEAHLGGFGIDETTALVRQLWAGAPEAWITDFHHLAGGNPRVECYALAKAKNRPEEAIEYLRPGGKSLAGLFHEQFALAFKKAGNEKQLMEFCSGVVALPRPIPIPHLAKATGQSEEEIRDICADLRPGIQTTGVTIGFADEDFEDFVRCEGEKHLHEVRARVANLFSNLHGQDAYAATHLASALLSAGRGKDLIELVESADSLKAIPDPVLRRSAQLQRLRLAMKVSRETGSTVGATITLLVGAEALKTDAAIRRMLVENPELAAFCASDLAVRALLRDPSLVQHHGPLIFHLIAAEARKGDPIPVRELRRQLGAWLRRRAARSEEETDRVPRLDRMWAIEEKDIAAMVEADLLLQGGRQAVSTLLNWRPRSLARRVGAILAPRLVACGDVALVERALVEAQVRAPWDLELLTPLALGTGTANVERLQSSLLRLFRLGRIRPERLRQAWNDREPIADYLECILTACEVVLAHGGSQAAVAPILELYANVDLRRTDTISPANAPALDQTLRAFALLERMEGRALTLKTFLVESSPRPGIGKDDARAREANERDRRTIEDLLAPFVALYDGRAQALLREVKSEDVDALLKAAIESLDRGEYRFSHSPNGSAMRDRAALSVARLLAIPELDRASLFERTVAVLDKRAGWIGPSSLRVLEGLGLDRSLHGPILHFAAVRAQDIKAHKVRADEKCAALTGLARTLLPISQADARALFSDAIEAAGEIDENAIHEIALFAPLSSRAAEAMPPAQMRTSATNLAVVASDASIRLSGTDRFPWKSVGEALATLDLPLSLAAVARWEDEDLVNREDLLPSVIHTALKRHTLSSTHASSLLLMLDEADEDLLAGVAQAAAVASSNVTAAIDEIASDELQRFGRGARLAVNTVLSTALGRTEPGAWLAKLLEAGDFHKSEANAVDAAGPSAPAPADAVELGPSLKGALKARRFSTPNEIQEAIAQQFREEESPHRETATQVLDRIATAVAVGDRAEHLDALGRCEDLKDYDYSTAVARRIEEWGDSPSVGFWCRERLLRAIVARLPAFSRWLSVGESVLPALLQRTQASSSDICAAIIEGIERHVDGLEAATIYALLALSGPHLPQQDAAALVLRYSDILARRVRVGDRAEWDVADVPSDARAGMARLLFSYMSDIDIRTRWRAAHAVRRLARLGDFATVDALVATYGRTAEKSYRSPEAPFYWQGARLWVAIALDRVAAETPLALRRHGSLLFSIATGEGFPHVLVRHFAKSAALHLLRSGTLTLGPRQRRALESANRPRMRRRGGDRKRELFDEYRPGNAKERRFHFDSLDTLPYWYNRAIRRFADVTTEQFLDAAEYWIVNEWGAKPGASRWAGEKRKGRLSDRFGLADHRHGSRPTLETYHTHLEWHAMWCACGSLLQTSALASKPDSDGGFEEWLGSECLAAPPAWLADLRGPKPLESQFWIRPAGDASAWLEGIGDREFLAELGLSPNRPLVVASDHETDSAEFDARVHVDTALVSGDVASSLLRALQSVEDPWDYRVPREGEDAEIRAAPYVLRGWLRDRDGDGGIDEGDALRFGVRGLECQPGHAVSRSLGLRSQYPGAPKWTRSRSSVPVFEFEAWGDSPLGEDELRRRQDSRIRSRGWRLRVDPAALLQFLNRVRFDLLARVSVTRRDREHEKYSRHDEEGAKEARFDKVLLLRRNGAIEAAEGRIGSWTTPRPRAGFGAKR